MLVGDAISKVATPVARWFGLGCVDPATGWLRPESTCAKVRDDLNDGRYADAFYDKFFKSTTKKGK
jgi:hypothetical protein